MPPEAQVPGQPVTPATGTAAAPVTPVQQTPPPPAPTTPVTPQATPQSQPAAGDDWHARYNGLQRAHQATVEQLNAASTDRQQLTQHAEALEQQMQALQAQAQTLAATQAAQAEALAQAQSDNQFWQMVNTDEYRQLAPFAEFIQRADTPEAQKAILDGMASRMGGQIAASADAVVRNQFSGITPAASVPATTPTQQAPSYEEVMEHVMDDNLARNNPTEHAKWMEIYNQHAEMNYESLGMGKFNDPTPNHYQTRRGDAATPEGIQGGAPQIVEPMTGMQGSAWDTQRNTG